jgi:hypothetical protein
MKELRGLSQKPQVLMLHSPDADACKMAIDTAGFVAFAVMSPEIADDIVSWIGHLAGRNLDRRRRRRRALQQRRSMQSSAV